MARGRPKKPELPAFVICPTCRISIQAGGDPNGCAFHECRALAPAADTVRELLATKGVLSEEQVRDAVLRALLATAASDASPTTLLELFRTLQPRVDGRTGKPREGDEPPISGALASWLAKAPR